MIYLVLAGLWILLSDRVLLLFYGNLPQSELTRLQTYKGWFFITTMAALLYALVHWTLSVIHGAQREMKAAKEAAESANHSKDRFLAALSHELRTPLTPVLAAVTALEHDASLPQVRQGDMALIRQQIELECKLIDDLLELTRLSNPQLKLNCQTVDMHGLVHNAVLMCRADLQRKSLGLEECLLAQEHHVRGDPSRLLQVLWNLIRNAVQFTPEGGRISIRTCNRRDSESCPGQWVVEVSDTGIGIEPASLSSIFDPLEQGPGRQSPQFGRFGVGLMVSKTIVALHGGAISAASAGPGRGATFRVELANVPAPKEAPPAPAPSMDRAGLKILLVEDHIETARVLSRLLRGMGHRVTVAEGVGAAMDRVREESFDLIISDIGLPDGDGVELIGQVQTVRPTRGIAISGYGGEGDIRRSLAAGFMEHLVKPISIDCLESALSRAATR